MPTISYPIVLPGTLGEKQNFPQEFLDKMVSPYSRNMEFFNGRLQGRGGLSKFSSVLLDSRPILTKAVLDLTDFGGVRSEIFATDRDIAKFDFGNSRFDYLTPVYSTGTVKVVNGSAVVHGGLSVDTCDTNPVAWVDGTGGTTCTPSRDTSVFQEGTASVKLTVAAGAGVELLAYHNITPINLHVYKSVGFWFRSSVNLSSGDLKFLLDDTAACASPLETLDIPAITANTWTWVNLNFATPANLTAIASIGIKQAVDKGAMVLNIDQIVVGDWTDLISVGDKFKIGSTSINTAATWYTVLTVDSNTQITLTATYAGSSADQQAYAIRLLFAGGSTNFWDWVQCEDTSIGQVIVMTNGIDMPIYWNGSGQAISFTTTMMPTNTTSAKYVSVFAGRLLMAWCVVDGANQPQRLIGWDPFLITSPDEDAFPIDFVDEPTQIVGMAIFGGYHIVFKDTNAKIGRFVGGDTIFDYEPSYQCKGVRSAWSIVVKNDFMYYYGRDKKIHRWNLLQDDIISEDSFPETVQFDPNQDEFVQGFDVIRRNQVRFLCPYASTSKNNYVYVYDYQQGIGLPWAYAEDDACMCIGSYRRTDDVYADDVIYGAQYADETGGYADDSDFLDNGEVVVMGGYDGYVRIVDSGSMDDGNEFTRLLRIKRLNFDLPDSQKLLRKTQHWFEAAVSGEVLIKLMTNDSSSYLPGTNTISLIPDSSDQDMVKRNVLWDIWGQDFQIEMSATNFFATLGFINYFLKKQRTDRGA